jgi:hypothetical protein
MMLREVEGELPVTEDVKAVDYAVKLIDYCKNKNDCHGCSFSDGYACAIGCPVYNWEVSQTGGDKMMDVNDGRILVNEKRLDLLISSLIDMSDELYEATGDICEFCKICPACDDISSTKEWIRQTGDDEE